LIKLLEAADQELAFDQAFSTDGMPSMAEIYKRSVEAEYLASEQKKSKSPAVAAATSAASLLSAQIAPPKKFKEITIKSFDFSPTDFTPKGTPQVSTAVLRKLAGNNPLADDPKDEVLGSAYETMGSGETVSKTHTHTHFLLIVFSQDKYCTTQQHHPTQFYSCTSSYSL